MANVWPNINEFCITVLNYSSNSVPLSASKPAVAGPRLLNNLMACLTCSDPRKKSLNSATSAELVSSMPVVVTLTFEDGTKRMRMGTMSSNFFVFSGAGVIGMLLN
jgi:hypothetical protein